MNLDKEVSGGPPIENGYCDFGVDKESVIEKISLLTKFRGKCNMVIANCDLSKVTGLDSLDSTETKEFFWGVQIQCIFIY
jgi:hypothetical protein